MSSPIAIVIGVGPGLGRALVEEFLSKRYKVALVARNKEKLLKHQNELEKQFKAENMFSVEGDLSSEKHIIQAVAAVEKHFGVEDTGVDVLVVNAGYGKIINDSILSVNAEEFATAFNMKFFNTLSLVRYVVPKMKKRNAGTILLTGGASSIKFLPGFTAVGAANASQRILALGLSHELKGDNVNLAVVTICGVIKTVNDGSVLDPKQIARVYSKLAGEKDVQKWHSEVFVAPPEAEKYLSLPVKNYNL